MTSFHWGYLQHSLLLKKMMFSRSSKRRKLTLAAPTLSFKDLPPELILFEILPYFQLELIKTIDPLACFGKFKLCIGWLNKPITIFRSINWIGAMRWVIPLDLVSIDVRNCDDIKKIPPLLHCKRFYVTSCHSFTTAPQELPSCKVFIVDNCPRFVKKPKLPKDCEIG